MEKNYDVIVCGGGMAGVAAACAASREGADVLLIERYGFLGGLPVNGFVNPFMTFCVHKSNGQRDWDKDVVCRGIFEEIINGLADLDGINMQYRSTFSEEAMKLTLDRIVKKYGVNVLFHSFIFDANIDNGNVASIKVANKNGAVTYSAKYFIDATGDADIVNLAGGEWAFGRETDGYAQPMTLCFRLADIDKSKLNYKEINEKYKQFRTEGKIKNPREDVLIFPHIVDDVLHFNSTRIIKKSAIVAEDLTEAEFEAREQVRELHMFLKNNIPGFENSKLLMTAPQVGSRESRRIIGEYLLTADDLMATTKFEDSVARGTYEIDIHNPTGSGTYHLGIPNDDYYTIPLRSMLPKNINNVAVAGKPISCTHEAHAAIRILPIVCCIGEGAGIAAGVALRNNQKLKDVNMKTVHEIMDKNNALY